MSKPKSMIQKIKKFFGIVFEGKTVIDKVKIILSFLGIQREIDIYNSDGKFHARANKSDLWMSSPLADIELREYFDLKEGTFIDVGANIGRYSILMGKKPNVKVIAFEPEPSNLKAFKKNIELNNLRDKIKVVPIALSDKKGKSSFYIDPTNAGGSSFEKRDLQEITVDTGKLDEIVKERGDFIKIDVEGAESQVLKGAIQTLKKFHPKIIFEAWDEEKLNNIREILEPLDYTIKKIAEENYLGKINQFRTFKKND